MFLMGEVSLYSSDELSTTPRKLATLGELMVEGVVPLASGRVGLGMLPHEGSSQ